VPLLALGLLTVLLGIAALVIDAGSWYRTQRHLQSVADAAALAAAQELPARDAGAAAEVATRYAAANEGALEGRPEFSTATLPNDTVAVTATDEAPAFFARIFGIESITVRARAAARALPLVEARRVVPIAVSESNPVIVCGTACYGSEVTLSYDNKLIGMPGAFGFLDLANSNGAVGTPTLSDWVRDGYPDPVPLGDYDSEPGNRFESGPVRASLDELATTHRTVLFPVYSSVAGSGAGGRYTIVGFAGFSITSWDPQGNDTTITGSFRELVRHGIGSRDAPYFGAKTVSLVR
jgi:hypothetical protein